MGYVVMTAQAEIYYCIFDDAQAEVNKTFLSDLSYIFILTRILVILFLHKIGYQS